MNGAMDLDDMVFDDDGSNKPKPVHKPATERQIGYMRDLLRDRKWDEMLGAMTPAWQAVLEDILTALAHNDNGTIAAKQQFAGSDVSKFIQELQKCPREQTAKQPHPNFAGAATQPQQHQKVELEDGMYRNPNDGTIYKLYHTVHGANVQVAKRLVQTSSDDWAFQYEGRKPIHSIRPSWKMELADAMQFGHIYSQCVVCGRTLTDELSMALGIGPVCGGREFGGEFIVLRDKKKAELGL